MYIVECVNEKYCYAKECIWDSEKKVYRNPGKCITIVQRLPLYAELK
jgi:hypothetical protein